MLLRRATSSVALVFGVYQQEFLCFFIPGGMKNESIIKETKTQRDDDIAYAIPKRYIKWNIGNMDL